MFTKNTSSRKTLSVVLAAAMCISAFTATATTAGAATVTENVSGASTNVAKSSANAYGLKNNIQDGVILHAWNWSFNNIKDKLPEIAAAGYTTVQTSPAQKLKENTVGRKVSGWWAFYQPADFKIDDTGRSALGTKADLEALCTEADKYGIKIVVDVVANHLANKSGYDLSPEIPADIRNDSSCWHDTWNVPMNYDQRYSITHGSMGGLPDLNTENSKIQNYAANYLKECIDVGVDGFRFDAAKHISVPDEGSQYTFWPNVLGEATNYAKSTYGTTPYYYGETLGATTEGGGPLATSYTKHMNITDDSTGNDIRSAVVKGNATAAASSVYHKGVSASDIVLWAESHDTYSGEAKLSTDVSTTDINKTWALVGSRNLATALYFARSEGYNTGTLGEIGSTECFSDEVAAVNNFHNYFAGKSEYLAYSGSIAYNERGTEGVVLVNCSGTSKSVSVKANKMANGTYTDQITGNKFTVSNGTISGNIGSTGIAVVYNNVVKSDVSATPGTNNGVYRYDTDTLTVILNAANVSNATYSIDGATAKSFADGTRITLGEGKAYETTQILTLKGVDLTGNTITKTYHFLKTDNATMVAFDNSSYNWSTVYAYIYNDALEEVAAWPGVKLTKNSNNIYDYELTSEFANGYVIWSDAGSSSKRYPADAQPGLAIGGTPHILKANYTWTEYELPTTPTEKPTEKPTEAPTEKPTEKPTEAPTEKPTEKPTEAPTQSDDLIYFVPSSNWSKDNARFAMYLFGNGNEEWVSMTETTDGYYTAELPEGYTSVIFVRMNPSTTANNWTNSWNQTADITLPTNDNNCFTLSTDGWDKISGTWSKHIVEIPTEKPTEAPTEKPTEKPTEAPTEKPTEKPTEAPTQSDNAVYFVPSSNWTKDNARFAMYLFGNGNEEWVSMTKTTDGYYTAELPEGYTSVIFVRMNPSTTTNNWTNMWNQTADITLPTNDNNCFTLSTSGWDKIGGTWSKHIVEVPTEKPTEKPTETPTEKPTEAPTEVAVKTLYLKPNANWIKSDARFAMYVTGANGSEWVSMTDLGDGYYSAEVPNGEYTTVSFGRMNGATTENTAANRFNYSADMTIPTDDTNCFTVDEGQWSNATGEWSVYVSKASLKKLYLKPNSNWIKSDARFAMYVTGENGSEWVSMEDAGDGCYTAYVPSNEYTKVTFARMNGATEENTLLNRWNYSAEMTIPTDDTNCFEVTAGQWNNATGTWEVFTPSVYEIDALYLKPNKNWASSNARFAVYLYGGESEATWVSMTKLADGSYKADIPTGDYTKVMFARMKGAELENIWANSVNASIEMDIPTNGTNRFTIGADQWSSATGEMDSITELKTLYLTPNKNWVSSNARFAMYLYGGESAATWVSMTSLGDGTYKANIPDGHYTKVIFTRMKGAEPENKWDNSVNESLALRIPVKGTDAFTVNNGEWGSAEGVWSTYSN